MCTLHFCTPSQLKEKSCTFEGGGGEVWVLSLYSCTSVQLKEESFMHSFVQSKEKSFVQI